MVTFYEDIPYSAAYSTGQKQKEIMDRVMQQSGIEGQWQQLNFREIADQLI
jgi:hypothetical protein